MGYVRHVGLLTRRTRMPFRSSTLKSKKQFFYSLSLFPSLILSSIFLFCLYSILKKNKERKNKEKQDKKIEPPLGKAIPGSVIRASQVDRRLLHNYRVVQRNLVYVIGIPTNACTEEILRRPEYFGQYGKIVKIVIHKNNNANHVYGTFAHKEDAKAAIQALEGFWMDGHVLRASFGTTKYCNNFIRGAPCSNPECVYLHELGDDDDRFTKEEIQQQVGYCKLSHAPGRDHAIVTGAGGPSGTGKRPAGETVLPQPVFLQEVSSKANAVRSNSANNLLQNRERGFAGSFSDIPSQSESGVSLKAEEPPLQNLSSHPEKNLNPSTASVPRDVRTPTDSVGSHASLQATTNNRQSQQYMTAASFNGIGKCAVFPVPISSLAISVWATILDVSSSDLTTNPFGLLSISELLELTLPPVDACLLSPWPKPLHYYK